jgi:hypothetical protein
VRPEELRVIWVSRLALLLQNPRYPSHSTAGQQLLELPIRRLILKHYHSMLSATILHSSF